MAKASKKKQDKKEEKSAVDFSKIEQPETNTLTNKLLIDTIQEMVAERQKENPKHPHVGVKEIALRISESTSIEVAGRDIRRKLQKIRKQSPDYDTQKGAKTGQVEVPAGKSQNPYEAPIVMQWANRHNKDKGIEYVVGIKE